jgi:hypothetical protein
MNADPVSVLRNWGCTDAEITGILRPDEPDADDRAGVIHDLDDLISATFDNPENRTGFPRLVNHNAPFGGRSLIERLIGADVAEFRRVYDALGHAFGRW